MSIIAYVRSVYNYGIYFYHGTYWDKLCEVREQPFVIHIYYHVNLTKYLGKQLSIAIILSETSK